MLLSVVDFDVCQLEKQRLNVASTDRRKYNDLTDAIAVLRAAEKLTVQNIAVANVIATQEAAQIVLDAGHAFPLPNKMMFCKMWCIDLMENHKHQEWGECVTPILRPNSTPRKWGVKQPLWAAIELDLSDWAKLAKVWAEGVFTNALWNMIESMSEAPVRKRFIKVCVIFLASTAHCHDALMQIDSAVSDFVATFTAVRQAMLGLLGLACCT